MESWAISALHSSSREGSKPKMHGDSLAFVVISVVAIVCAIVATHFSRRRGWLPLLLMGLFMRMVGSLAYFHIVMNQYQGAADAISYYRNGLVLADRLLQGDLSGFFAGVSAGSRWWGTPFVDAVSGLVLAAIGPSLKGEFLVFALISFLGLLAIVEAVRRTSSPSRTRGFAKLVFFWPSLWFWPCTVGKESLVIFGLGLASLGYVGREGKTQWLWLVTGVVVTFCCRPHVALVFMLGMLLAHVLRPGVSFSLVRVAQLCVIVLATWVTFIGMANLFGFEERYQQEIGDFAEMKAENTLRGGSSMVSTPLQEGKPWLAFVNFWLRPFPWRAGSALTAFAAAEVLAFWLMVLGLRRSVWSNLKRWRHDALLRFAIPVVVGYSLMLGSIVGNVGILVRQRAVILPLAFLFVAADTRLRHQVRSARGGGVINSTRRGR